jgi:uncharacterized protein (DUF1778 family)
MLDPVFTTPFVWNVTVIAFRATDDREKLLDQARSALDRDADAEVIDAALRHAVEEVENLEAVKHAVSPELAERLSAEEIRLAQYPQAHVD